VKNENEHELFKQLMSKVVEFVSARAVEDKLAAVEARGFVDDQYIYLLIVQSDRYEVVEALAELISVALGEFIIEVEKRRIPK